VMAGTGLEKLGYGGSVRMSLLRVDCVPVRAFVCVCCVRRVVSCRVCCVRAVRVYVAVHCGLLPRLLLHDLWAGMSRLLGLPASTWSAVHGSLRRVPSWHNQHVVALSRTAFARR